MNQKQLTLKNFRIDTIQSRGVNKPDGEVSEINIIPSKDHHVNGRKSHVNNVLRRRDKERGSSTVAARIPKELNGSSLKNSARRDGHPSRRLKILYEGM
jgi:hypothetical protein